MIFTPSEAATLTGLYPQIDDWWMYYYALSDEIELRNPLAADCMRWLYPQRQRPAQVDVFKWQWWTHKDKVRVISERSDNRTAKITGEFLQNYLPWEFCSICHGGDLGGTQSFLFYSSLLDAIEAPLWFWVTLSAADRSRLWSEWT